MFRFIHYSLSSPVSTAPSLKPKTANRYIIQFRTYTSTYDHRTRRTGHPVRSAIHKPCIGRLVVEWVTINEYLLLYVFFADSFDFSGAVRPFCRHGKQETLIARNQMNTPWNFMIHFIFRCWHCHLGSPHSRQSKAHPNSLFYPGKPPLAIFRAL